MNAAIQGTLMRTDLLTLAVAVFISACAASQQKPEFGRLPNIGANRIEVRFALGKKAVTCQKFTLKARIGQRWIMDGEYASGFEIPSGAKDLPRNDELDLEFQCGQQHWHFTSVGERAFLPGWWWVGTDYPPFQRELQGSKFKDALWVRYFITDTTNDSGFTIYHECPAKLKVQKPGPCYED
jgi:hypothetical protein